MVKPNKYQESFQLPITILLVFKIFERHLDREGIYQYVGNMDLICSTMKTWQYL